jgi:hypothetical protein
MTMLKKKHQYGPQGFIFMAGFEPDSEAISSPIKENRKLT